jgi:hypothetical protein
MILEEEKEGSGENERNTYTWMNNCGLIETYTFHFRTTTSFLQQAWDPNQTNLLGKWFCSLSVILHNR